jgi:hypothetical protein
MLEKSMAADATPADALQWALGIGLFGFILTRNGIKVTKRHNSPRKGVVLNN